MPASEAQRWKIEENQILLDAGPYATDEHLAEKLPGRTASAVAGQRQRLGLFSVHPAQKRPETIGARPLLAKTCTACGRLLQAEWFGRDSKSKGGGWRSRCRVCRSAMEQGHQSTNPSEARLEAKMEQWKEWEANAQALTLTHAERNGASYIDRDHAVLSDPDLTILQKALKLQRTYRGVASFCRRAGYRSAYGLGEPTDLWRIFNPNEPERVSA